MIYWLWLAATALVALLAVYGLLLARVVSRQTKQNHQQESESTTPMPEVLNELTFRDKVRMDLLEGRLTMIEEKVARMEPDAPPPLLQDVPKRPLGSSGRKDMH